MRFEPNRFTFGKKYSFKPKHELRLKLHHQVQEKGIILYTVVSNLWKSKAKRKKDN